MWICAACGRATRHAANCNMPEAPKVQGNPNDAAEVIAEVMRLNDVATEIAARAVRAGFLSPSWEGDLEQIVLDVLRVAEARL